MTQTADEIQRECELLAKWRDYLPPAGEVSRARAVVTSRFLSTQEYSFDQLDRVDYLVKVVGKDWRVSLLRGIARAFAKHRIHEMVGVQPAVQPVCGVHYLKLVHDVSGLWTWKPETKSVGTKPRKLGYMDALPAFELWSDVSIAELVFEAALNEVALEVALALRAATKLREPNAVDRLAGVVDDPVGRERQRVWERSGWEPNVIVGHTSRAIERHNARYVGWPQLPDDQALLLHRSDNGQFGSAVWVPFVFQIAPRHVDPETFQSSATLLIRHAIEIVDPESIGVAWLEEKEAA